MRVTGAVDVCLSHDWPRGIAHHGDTAQLLRKKPCGGRRARRGVFADRALTFMGRFFTQEVKENSLGSLPAEQLLHRLRPKCGLPFFVLPGTGACIMTTTGHGPGSGFPRTSMSSSRRWCGTRAPRRTRPAFWPSTSVSRGAGFCRCTEGLGLSRRAIS